MAFNTIQKLKDNAAALGVAFDWEHGRQLTAEDLAVLQRYAGFGGIKAILYPVADKEEWVKLGKRICNSTMI
jgi:hypothetical protein